LHSLGKIHRHVSRLYQPHLFPTLTQRGFGIGSNVVAAHRGKINVETEPGQGTEFLIRLPQDSAGEAVA